MTTSAVLALAGFELRLTDRVWPFAGQHREAIAAHWAEQLAKYPDMWDGEVLLADGLSVDGGIVRGAILRVRFSAYLKWRAMGRPEAGVMQIFGAAVIRGTDGALVFGVQGSGIGEGEIKPPGGLLDTSDVAADGTVDVFAAMARELREETGLNIEDATAAGAFAMQSGSMLAVARVHDFPQPAEDVASGIRETLRQQAKPELADVVVIRSIDDLDPQRTKPRWMDMARHALVLAPSS